VVNAIFEHHFQMMLKFIDYIDWIGYTLYLLVFFSFRNDGTEFNGSLFQRVNDDLETGVQLKWAAGSNATSFGIAAKYCPDKDSTYRVRFFCF